MTTEPQLPQIISARTELWFAWAEIAGEHELAAAEWRAKAERAVALNRNPSRFMSQETKAAVASVAASGAALETFGKNLRQYATDPKPPAGAANRLLSQVRLVYPAAPIGDPLAERVREAFRTRNHTLHYSSEAEPLGMHPIGTQTTWVARTFTLEAARASLDTLADFIEAVVIPGRSPIERAEWWALYCRKVGARIRKRKKAPLDVTR